jgi:hypothetical protein
VQVRRKAAPESVPAVPQGKGIRSVGRVGENILEFIAGDEVLKGLSLGEKFLHASKLAKMVETSPALAKVFDIGMTALRQGTVSGAQTFEKGGTTTQAAENAGITGTVSALAKSPEAIAAAKEAADQLSKASEQMHVD